MTCDFLLDDDGTIWLFAANEILARKVMKTELELTEEKTILKNLREKKIAQQKIDAENRKDLKRIMKKTYEKIAVKNKEFDEKYPRKVQKSHQ